MTSLSKVMDDLVADPGAVAPVAGDLLRVPVERVAARHRLRALGGFHRHDLDLDLVSSSSSTTCQARC